MQCTDIVDLAHHVAVIAAAGCWFVISPLDTVLLQNGILNYLELVVQRHAESKHIRERGTMKGDVSAIKEDTGHREIIVLRQRLYLTVVQQDELRVVVDGSGGLRETLDQGCSHRALAELSQYGGRHVGGYLHLQLVVGGLYIGLCHFPIGHVS